ncbi:MAG: DUF6506 family protein [Candidatus Geothermincolia bacterium]
MAFKAAFLAHAPDADPEKHRAVIDTGKYKLFVTVIRNQEQALAEARRLVADEGVTSILLCPGFTNVDIAELDVAVGETCGISVARGDPPSSRIAVEVMKKEWA